MLAVQWDVNSLGADLCFLLADTIRKQTGKSILRASHYKMYVKYSDIKVYYSEIKDHQAVKELKFNIIIKRKLKDYEAWKKVVSSLDGLRRQYGSKGMTVYRNADDPNEVYLVVEWDDGMPYTNYFTLPEVKKVLADTGTTEVVKVSESFHLEG